MPIFREELVVHEASERLAEENDEDDYSDDGMCFAHETQCAGHVDSHGESDDLPQC